MMPGNPPAPGGSGSEPGRARPADPRLRHIDGAQLLHALPIVSAVDILQAAFSAGLDISAPQRTHLPLADASFLTMPAAGAGASGEPVGGVKVVTIRPANAELGVPTVQAVYLLFGGPSMSPLAVIDGPALTNLRTSAVSALATRLLARDDARSLVVFGAGAQAFAHVAALPAVRPVRDVVIVSRSVDRAQALVDHAAAAGLRTRLGTPDDVRSADIVCTCTTSPRPLFDGSLLRPGTHVVAVGAYQPDTRELDETTIARGRVVVEHREIALAEAGDLAIPVAAGRFDMADVAADLAELCAGAVVRRSERDITVFKSVGMAAEDLVIADAAYRALTAE